jgi:L-alanine-DL-glutamate epimerase-like enolase superfamily enzyme
MKIESVDLFYLSMPQVLDIGDGSQDALLVRVRAGGLEGWGECEASPLTSIASYVCPMSHAACKPVGASVLGQRLHDPSDVARIGRLVRQNSFDLLQADHTLSGIDTALWDVMGKRLGAPAWQLLGWKRAFAKRPYASLLFGDAAADTLVAARKVRAQGYTAAKFGWGPYGKGSVEADADQVAAAREGVGPDADLLIDAGTAFGTDVEAAALRLPALASFGAVWLEEPFEAGALSAYAALSARGGPVRIAGGEEAHNLHQAVHMIDYAGVGFIQIDAGRIGGLTPSKGVAEHAVAKGVTYVNHTFTSHVALAASLHPYAGLEAHHLCEYPVAPKPLCAELTKTPLPRDADGLVRLPERPGVGVDPDPETIKKYLVDLEIMVAGRVLYRMPQV